MRLTEQQHLLSRYRQAGLALCEHIEVTERAANRFGLAYLTEHLAEDIARELRLQDAWDDVVAELSAELLEADVIVCGGGYYKIDALGMPHFYEGVPVEVAS